MHALTRLPRVLTSHGPQTTVPHLDFQAQVDLLSEIRDLQFEQAAILAQAMDRLAAVANQVQPKIERSRSARYVLY